MQSARLLRSRCLAAALTILGGPALTGCRAMTWNVEGNRPSAPVRAWKDVIINQGAPWVIALQQICVGDLERLRDELAAAGYAYQAIFFRTMALGAQVHCSSDYGNAFLTRFAAQDVRCTYIGVPGGRDCARGLPGIDECKEQRRDDRGMVVSERNECRLMMSMKVDVPDRSGNVYPTRVFNVHASPWNPAVPLGEQIRLVAAAARQSSQPYTVVMGDFNVDSWASAEFAPFRDPPGATAFTDVGGPSTVPPAPPHPPLKPDYILVRGPTSHATGAPGVMPSTSDHFPLWADLGP